jgi:formylglycine-generating enzyme required for sulfatase activity
MKPMKAIAALGVAFGMMAAGMTGAQAITIDTVIVGNPGNAPDLYTGSLYGAVNYTYAIGKYEVNLNQYTAFLNAVAATDTYSLYNPSMATYLNIAGISRSGSNGTDTYSVIGSGLRPVTFVSWFDAARFANWMANGQPTGAQNSTTTEDGAYALNGATSGIFTKNAINPNTGAPPTWWIPSEDEWYKAAYYDQSLNSGTGGYWLYPTQSEIIPGNTIGAAANQANYMYYNGSNYIYSVTQNASYSSSQNYLTDGGAFSNSGSFYGTFDQGGNVWEWNDAVIFGSDRGLRGGSWYDDDVILQSSSRFNFAPTFENNGVGFRVASVPEPSTAVLMLLGGGAYWLVRRRKVTPLEL